MSLNFTGQSNANTKAPPLPTATSVKQQYSGFADTLPAPVDNPSSELTQFGILPMNDTYPPVENSNNQPVQAVNTQNHPVDNFVNIQKQYDLSSYNSVNSKYFKTLGQIYDNLPDFKDTQAANSYIQTKFKGSKITGEMFNAASSLSGTPSRLLAAFAQLESHYGLSKRAIKYNNATGYGALDSGPTRGYKDFQDNLNHTALHLARLKN